MPQKVPHVLVAPIEDRVDAHKVGPGRVGRDERRQGRAVRVGSPRSDHDGLDLLLLRAVAVHASLLAVRCRLGSIDGGASPARSGRASCGGGGGERSSPIEVSLEGLFHTSFDSIKFEVVPPRAEGDEGFDLREGGDAADIDGEYPRQGGQVLGGGGGWRIDRAGVYAVRRCS